MEQKAPTAARPRYRHIRGVERFVRGSGLWRRTGNTLPPLVNALYWRHLAQSRAVLLSHNPAVKNWPEPASVTKGFAVVRGALNRNFAEECSRRFSHAIEHKEGIITQTDAAANSVRLVRPIDAFGDPLFDVFRGPLNEALERHFRSYYRVEWIDCYRSFPTPQRKGSWLWHKDNVPYACIKVMLHLTKTTADTGAMRFLDWDDTNRLHQAGYFGIRARERVPDIESDAEKRGVPITVRHVDAEPGDILIFNNNLLHSAVPPHTTFRDVMTMLILPSDKPWDKVLQHGSRDVLQDVATSYPARP